jgi:signal transduction histidine kinase/ligand-binding sensor domain-containing protein
MMRASMEKAHRLRGAVALGIVLACCPCASALNPSLDINQYGHASWTIREGFFKGVIYSIAQTPDGYLWLGTELGLFRFDGVRSAPWQPPAGDYLPSSNIPSLLATGDGRLWIGTTKGLASWKDGKLTHYPELAGQAVDSLLEDRDGTVWAGGNGVPAGILCAMKRGTTQCYGRDGSLGRGVLSLYEDSGDNLWAGAMSGLWRWKAGPPRFYPMPNSPAEINSLIEGDNGALWMAMPGGMRQLVNGKAEVYALPGIGRQLTPLRLLRDRNGSLWIGTQQGLLHLHHGRTDLFAESDGLSGAYILALFQDHEGSIWVATSNGLDRFRDFAVTTISAKQGLSSSIVWSVLAGRDGSLWLGTPEGLNRWNDGKATIYRTRSGLPDDVPESLSEDDRGRIWVSTRRAVVFLENGRLIPVSAVPGGVVHSMAGDRAGNLWIGYQDHGLFHLHEGTVVERISWASLGRKDFAFALFPDRILGGLWLGFYQGGVAYLKGGQIRASYAVADGLGGGRVNSFQLDRDGALWAATEGGLSRVKDGRVATLSSKNGLPCDTVHWTMEDDDHSIWLYMACGLVRIARRELDAWATDSKRMIQGKVFDSSDGARIRATAGRYSPRVAKSADGRLWFDTGDGVSVVDPSHLNINKLLPPVNIEQITADRKTYWNSISDAASLVRLPPLVRDLEIDYTALNLVAPEKIRFRVKLEGWDGDWKDAGNDRKAFYSYLPPRNYRFRVMACNDSGMWNEAGASFDFSVAPAYYQTTWFRALCVAAFLGLLWALYQFRLHRLQRQFNAGLEARINERTRIARELHDTLLQSFHGLMFQFQAARNMLPRRTEEAMQALDEAIGATEQAITESRGAIQDLRSEQIAQGDLAELMTTMGQELTDIQNTNRDSPIFRVIVEGKRQTVDPILQNEVCRITREILRNAVRHAHAHRIEAEIRYDDQALRLRIRDDGRGLDPKVLEEGGTVGHWGLRGVRERAQQIGAQLDFWSEAGAGTEVQLTVPAAVAYKSRRDGSRFKLFQIVKRYGKRS